MARLLSCRLRSCRCRRTMFSGTSSSCFNRIPRDSKLKVDRDGNKRTAYGLRHTYICMRT
jgi:hypothetical protein